MSTAALNRQIGKEIAERLNAGGPMPTDEELQALRDLCRELQSEQQDMERQAAARVVADAVRFRKLMDLAVYGGTWQSAPDAPIQHVWRFRPIMGPHANLSDAIDAMGE